MRNNRLINDFRFQSNASLWKLLDAMANNYAVYSCRIKGIAPYLKDKVFYVYTNDTNLVVVCLDECGHGPEQTYRESDTLSPMILNPGHEPRESTVWKMVETIWLVKRLFRTKGIDMAVHGVLITEAEIRNAYELDDMWEEAHITVYEGYRKLRSHPIKVNADRELPCRIYADMIAEATFEELNKEENAMLTPEVQKEEKAYEEEMNRLLQVFMKGETEEDEDPMDMSEEEVPNWLDVEKEDEEEDDALPQDNDVFNDRQEDNFNDKLEDDFFPDGQVEQNQNTCVKVDVLRPIAHPREELDKLVGCEEIKHRMDELVALSQYNNMMQELFPDIKHHAVSLHSVFLGRPGTGKTTVCKILGSLLRQVGALSKGHVVVCDRSTFIGTLWGDEERSIKQVLEMAQGGVLMIDEAYLLNSHNERDPGRMVIQMLMNILANEMQRDIAVVLCGYKEPMMKLLDTNPGLRSRFPNKFEFTDFSVDELLEITRQRISGYNYEFTPQAWEKYRQLLTQAYQMRDPESWGNARFVANQLERIYIQHASRCVSQQPTAKAEFLKLTPEDIVPIEIPRPKAKIGF